MTSTSTSPLRLSNSTTNYTTIPPTLMPHHTPSKWTSSGDSDGIAISSCSSPLQSNKSSPLYGLSITPPSAPAFKRSLTRSTGAVIKKTRRVGLSNKSNSSTIDNTASFNNSANNCSNATSTPTKSSSANNYSHVVRQLSFNTPQMKRTKNQALRGDRFIPDRPLISDMNCMNLYDLYNAHTLNDLAHSYHLATTENHTDLTSESGSSQEELSSMRQFHDNLDRRMFDGQLKQTKVLNIQKQYSGPYYANKNHYPDNNNINDNLSSNRQQVVNNNNINNINNYMNCNEQWQTNIRKLYNHNKNSLPNYARDKRNMRDIPTQPEKILDAPGLIDDFYLNLLDWSSNNLLAVALSDSVYLWNAETGAINRLLTCSQQSENSPQNHVTSLAWIDDGSYLAVGMNDNDVQLWDIERQKRVRSLKGHVARVGALSWNSHILSSGSRSGKIINHDVRVMDHVINTLAGHNQEVCGLKWSADGTQLASGGNDNLLNIWDLNQHVTKGYGRSTHTEPRFSFSDHRAAVKALAWCPWNSSLLASGGGTQDRQLKFWNSQSGKLVQSIDTKSQVCSIVWSKYERELVSSHGFSQNQLIVWKYPKLKKIAELTGHTSRVLHMAQSPDGTTIVSGAGDETLRFWKIFSAPEDATREVNGCKSLLSLRNMSIR